MSLTSVPMAQEAVRTSATVTISGTWWVPNPETRNEEEGVIPFVVPSYVSSLKVRLS